jgi:hypothetical protein
MALALVFTILRHLRYSEASAAEVATKNYTQEFQLRRALETLGTQQCQAVFAKNVHRQFIFCNEVFLEWLAPIAQRDGWLGPSGRVTWKDVNLKTDAQLGIDCDDFVKSDRQVLDSNSANTDHFEGYYGVICIDYTVAKC